MSSRYSNQDNDYDVMYIAREKEKEEKSDKGKKKTGRSPIQMFKNIKVENRARYRLEDILREINRGPGWFEPDYCGQSPERSRLT